MFANLKIGGRLAAGFALVLLLTAAIGVIADVTGSQLAELTTKLYQHPFAVTNALLDARANIIAMHRSMKDVALAKTPEELDRAVADVDAREKHVYAKFDLVRERFLGDKSDLEAAAKAFAAWKPTRDEVIRDIRDGRRDDAAAITKTTGAAQVHDINTTLDKVVDFAMNKAESFMANAEAKSRQTALLTRSCLAGTILLGLVIAWTITRGITRPVNAMTGVMGQLAGNNLTVDVPFTTRHDEIGAMAKSVGHFKDQLLRVRQLEADQEEQKRRAEADRQAALRKMADGFEGSVGKVIETVTSAATELQAASGQMAGTAAQTSSQATAVAASAQQASTNVQTVASATEELASSIKEIAHQVERSQTVSSRAGDEAGNTTTQIKALSDNVGKIGEIVSLINDIAAQTNLLALNATIEAARAGEAGKGFAVVAGEVKGLANQTAKATSEIASQIQAVQEGTDAAVHAIDSISKVIGEMREISSAVAAAVEQQTAATGEIARNVEQAARGTQDVSANIASVEQAARETGAAAEQIRDSAGDLSRQAEFLRHEVGTFLTQVRADTKDMTLLHWTGDLAMGIPSVDRYHQEIFNQVNEFHRQMMAGDGGKAAIALLAEVGRTVQAHFAEEEGLMAQHRYGGADDHRRHHKAFLERIAGLKAAIEANQPEAVPQLFDYVATWIGNHVRNDDKALALFLRDKRAA
jgi:methyl-accepting chemotaxis protein